MNQFQPHFFINPSIGTLMEGNQHVVTAKQDFDNRDESLLIAIVGIFRQSEIRWKFVKN